MALGCVAPWIARSKKVAKGKLSRKISASPSGRPYSRMKRFLRASGNSTTWDFTKANQSSVGTRGIKSGSGK